jgi:hypothetical protein
MLEQLTLYVAYASFAGITLYGHALMLKALWRHPGSDETHVPASVGSPSPGSPPCAAGFDVSLRPKRAAAATAAMPMRP